MTKADEMWHADSEEWCDDRPTEMVGLCQALAAGRVGSMDSRERKAHRDLEHKSAFLIPAKLKTHTAACMTNICARDGAIAIPWAVASKAFFFAMHDHEHRVKILRLFPPLQK